ncbi:transposase [Nocardioides sp.]|uniref:transposase n=1 Tax=Nocardioides sp. TaxID=35761 RepID=UPI002616CB0C|nr:transposase [Nocardioides sp.]
MADWLPEDHLAWFVIDVVAELDMSSFLTAYRLDDRGGAAYDPQMMLALLVYSYCVGERSSRRIERRLVEDVAFGWLRPTSSLTTPRSRGSGPAARRRSRACSARSSRYAHALSCCAPGWSRSTARS